MIKQVEWFNQVCYVRRLDCLHPFLSNDFKKWKSSIVQIFREVNTQAVTSNFLNLRDDDLHNNVEIQIFGALLYVASFYF